MIPGIILTSISYLCVARISKTMPAMPYIPESPLEIRNGEFTEIRDNLKDFLDIPVVIYNVDESL